MANQSILFHPADSENLNPRWIVPTTTGEFTVRLTAGHELVCSCGSKESDNPTCDHICAVVDPDREVSRVQG